MKLIKSLLLGSAAGIAAVAGANAADLPSRKAAPASFVKICDAYGAGFFYIPGTDTCLRVGGYVRAQYDFTPGRDVYVYGGDSRVINGAANFATLVQRSRAIDSNGTEVRGRVDLDARTQTPWGTARTLVRLRGANASGIRNQNEANNGLIANSNTSATALTVESALIQWAGFTFGVAPNNYAFMPSQFYNGNPWAGFPNGQKQLAYTATFGGGLSATLALEDRGEWGFQNGVANETYISRPTTTYNLTGNIRWDQPWGFAVVHGVIGNSSVREDYATVAGFGSTPLTTTPSANGLAGNATFGTYAFGGTVQFNLPMLGTGDKLWLTANYAHGLLGALSSNGLSTVSVGAQRRLFGGIIRADQPVAVTGGAGTLGNPYTVGITNGWNVAAAMTHYWAPQWRSNFNAGMITINPPTSALTSWGRGRVILTTGSLVYSPAKDFDIGVELQYANIRNTIQNPSAAFIAQGSPGLKDNMILGKLRVERTF